MNRILFLLVLPLLSFKGEEETTFDRSTFDLDLMKEFVQERLTADRVKRRKVEFEYNADIDSLAKSFLAENVRRKFNRTGRYKVRAQRSLRKRSYSAGIFSGEVKIAFFQLPIFPTFIDFKYDKRGDSLSFNLYEKRERSISNEDESENETTQEEELEKLPLLPYSYEILAMRIQKEINYSKVKRYISDRAGGKIGIAMALDQKTLDRSRIPELKVVVIYAGNLLSKIPD